MRTAATIVAVLTILGAVFLLRALPIHDLMQQQRHPRRLFETALRSRGSLLVKLPTPAPRQVLAATTYEPNELRQTLYARKRDDDTRYIHFRPDGRIIDTGQDTGRIARQVEILRSHEGGALFIDGDAFLSLDQWDLHWVTDAPELPHATRNDYPPFRIIDGFMRSHLDDGQWITHSGEWALNQHGGGAPETEAQLADFKFQRAVNPFTLRGRNVGLISLGTEPRPHCHFEARFYFGRPRTAKTVDHVTLPDDTDMLLAVGNLEGHQAAFGWVGAERTFAIVTRKGNAPWHVLERWQGKRPPLTNWTRIAIQLRHGHTVTGLLDGEPVLRAALPQRIEGPVHVACGDGTVELDDVRCYSLPGQPDEGAPIHVQSRNFAGKRLKDRADGREFAEWTRGTDTFTQSTEWGQDNRNLSTIRNRLPLFGQFLYESVPHDDHAGTLPAGQYRFRVERFRAEPDDATTPLIIEFHARRTADGWSLSDVPEAVWPPGHQEFTLRFGRRVAAGNRIAIRVGDRFVPLTEPVAGPLTLAIGRYYAPGDAATTPAPEHHTIFSSNLVNEFFEVMPTDWNWIEGAFRMDARWACQANWNFMACGSPGLPMLVSKRRFHGAQEHDFFMSIRPVLPWDAGDTEFRYDNSMDHGNRFFHENGGWYNRRDLNFSFCCDGRNPLSGYAVVYAGYDNSKTMLMRKGEIVAATDRFRFPAGSGPTNVHWKWWHFQVTRHGPTIRVHCNGNEMFRYDDPEPLDGGHIALWSVRNGFVVSRLASTAADITIAPHHLYVAEDAPSPWRPVIRDAIHLTANPGPCHTRATYQTGAGFHALRWTPDQPVELNDHPVLELPIVLDDDCRANIHLHIGDQSYLILLNGPLERVKSLLTPQYQRGEQFRVPVIAPETLHKRHVLARIPAGEPVRVDLLEALRRTGYTGSVTTLTSITIGNTSNRDYLVAGNGGNRAGTGFTVGTPAFRPREPR